MAISLSLARLQPPGYSEARSNEVTDVDSAHQIYQITSTPCLPTAILSWWKSLAGDGVLYVEAVVVGFFFFFLDHPKNIDYASRHEKRKLQPSSMNGLAHLAVVKDVVVVSFGEDEGFYIDSGAQ